MRHLALDNYIDICKASETAASHSDALGPDNVNRVSMANNETIQRNANFAHSIIRRRTRSVRPGGKFAISVET